MIPPVRLFRALGAAVASALVVPALAADGGSWAPLAWNGEDAWASERAGWRVVVSVDRGRLVHFGPANTGENLLFAPPTRDGPNGWGGHRVWLGPQAEWPAVWPPDPAWEATAAATATVDGDRLELRMETSAGDWGSLTRVYSWQDDGLACAVQVRGGARAAQVIQIMQVRADAAVRVQARPEARTPHGFVVLEIGSEDQVRRTFPWPLGVLREGGRGLVLRTSGTVVKLGFAPQPLVAKLGEVELALAPGAHTGRVVGEIDDGFTTQVYLGRSGVPFLELEQLSPRFAAGEDASATILLGGRRP